MHFKVGLLVAAYLVLLVLPWWRNHALLLDFYDYGLVMAAAGRMQLGERPYLDFVSPIQTLQFVGATLAEQFGGPRYLSLTYAALAFILVSFIGLALLFQRTLGAGLGLLLSATLIVASAGQHTIVWYNAMGVVWLTVVVWITAQTRDNASHRFWRLGLVWAALWLGGMTKLTFQAAALAFAFTFTFRSASMGWLSWRSARLRFYSFFFFGALAPVATELLVTGATLEQWFANVIVLPARFRTQMLEQIATWRFYFQTPHDYYQPLFLKFAGAWGVAVLLTTVGAIALRLRKQHPRPPGIEWAFLLVLAAGVWICSAVLLATNMDIAYLSAAVPLALSAGLVRAYSHMNTAVDQRRTRAVLAVSAVTLLVPAWLAAWSGTRALWGHEPLNRTALVSTNDLPSRFSYVRDMKILPTLHADLRALEKTIAELSTKDVPPSEWHFTNGTEWLVRAVPEARHRDLPLWLAPGTTFSDDDTWQISEQMEQNGVRVIFSYEGWNYWFGGMQTMLADGFLHRVVGRRLHVFERRDPRDPVEFAINTHSNLYARELSVKRGPVELGLFSNGLFYFGGRRSHRIDVGFGLFRLEGELVGELAANSPAPSAKAVFRIFAREGDQLTDLLWDETVTVDSTKRMVTRPFSISPGGRAVTLTLHVPNGNGASFGWRKLQTEHVGMTELRGFIPLDSRLASRPLDEASLSALLGSARANVSDTRLHAAESRVEIHDGQPHLITSSPAEIWIHLVSPAIKVAGSFQIQPSPGSSPDTSDYRVAVIAFKAGRFDVRERRELNPYKNAVDGGVQSFETWLPENSGWIGIVVTNSQAENIPPDAIRWNEFRVW